MIKMKKQKLHIYILLSVCFVEEICFMGFNTQYFNSEEIQCPTKHVDVKLNEKFLLNSS